LNTNVVTAINSNRYRGANGLARKEESDPTMKTRCDWVK